MVRTWIISFGIHKFREKSSLKASYHNIFSYNILKDICSTDQLYKITKLICRECDMDSMTYVAEETNCAVMQTSIIHNHSYVTVVQVSMALQCCSLGVFTESS